MLRLVSVAAMIMGVNAHVFQPMDSEFLEVTTSTEAVTPASTPTTGGDITTTGGDNTTPSDPAPKKVGVVWTN